MKWEFLREIVILYYKEKVPIPAGIEVVLPYRPPEETLAAITGSGAIVFSGRTIATNRAMLGKHTTDAWAWQTEDRAPSCPCAHAQIGICKKGKGAISPELADKSIKNDDPGSIQAASRFKLFINKCAPACLHINQDARDISSSNLPKRSPSCLSFPSSHEFVVPNTLRNFVQYCQIY